MAWDTLCAGTAAYFDVLFPGEGLKLFQVEPCPPGRQMGDPRAGRSRHRVPSQPVFEEAPVCTGAELSDSMAWDSVRESMSAYFDVPSFLRLPAWDVLFPEEGFETGLRNLGSHSMPSYFVPEREVPKAAAGDMSPEKDCAAPPFLEAYLELAFPGEGLNLFEGRSAHQCASPPRRSGKCSQSEWSGAASQKRPPVPEDRELRASLGKVYSSEVMPPAPEVPVDGDSKIAPGSLDSDSVSTASGSEAVPTLLPSSSNNSLDLWSSDSALASSDATGNEEGLQSPLPMLNIGVSVAFA